MIYAFRIILFIDLILVFIGNEKQSITVKCNGKQNNTFHTWWQKYLVLCKLSDHKMSKEELVIGLDFSTVSNVNTSVSTACEAGFNRYFIPVAHPRYKREFENRIIIENQGDNYSRSVISVSSQDYIAYIIGKLSDHVNVDNANKEFRKFSEEILDQEMKWCSYLGITNVLITLPMQGPIVNLARIVNSKMKQHSPQFMVRVPMLSPLCARADFLDSNIPVNDSWSRWNSFRMYCASDKKIRLALEFTDDLPDDYEIERWLGEPVAFVFLKTNTFISNQAGFPVLSKGHQVVAQQFLFRRIPFVITGAAPEDLKPHYVKYIKHLSSSTDSNQLFREYVQGYEDFLQIPLQPLMDNLDQYTYEVFEKDPVKYREYQRAIKLALIDKKNVIHVNATPLVVMVVGAGRGPIVNAALKAAEESDTKIKLYAIEKNPHAIVSLQRQKLEHWKDDVTIVAADMRKWETPERADIMISELLGSFGDNELSPECLDGAQRFLKDDGICIPNSYTSYICPTQTHKIYAEVNDCLDREKPVYQRFEQPYVVHLQTVYQISGVQKLFTFNHPTKDGKLDNTRFETLNFDVKQDCVMHGFSGFFDTILYKDVVLSIVPETFTEGMFSWFPIFFPIKEPLLLKKGENVSISVWRLKNEKIVWYEWLVNSPVSGSIHNPNGRSYSIGLT